MPHVLSKMYPGHSENCWRCGTENGPLLHIFWNCTLIRLFWHEVRTHLTKFTERQVPTDASFFLLHHNCFPARTYQRSVLPHMLNTARICVAECRKKQTPPSIVRWLLIINRIRRMEELLAIDLEDMNAIGTVGTTEMNLRAPMTFPWH